MDVNWNSEDAHGISPQIRPTVLSPVLSPLYCAASSAKFNSDPRKKTPPMPPPSGEGLL